MERLRQWMREMCVCEYYLCMRSQVTLWHTFIYLWQRHHYTALSPHDPLTPITHYHKNNTTYFFSAQLSTLIVSGCQNVTCQESDECTSHESPGPESLRLLYRCFWQEIKDVGLAINYWHWNRQPVGWRRDQWMRGPGGSLAWCEVCHCLYLPNQQSLLCHCPPPAVKMFECPHNTKLTRKWRQYTLFYTFLFTTTPSRTQMTLKI